MPSDAEQTKVPVVELAARFRSEMIPLTGKFSYFSTVPVAEDDLRQYLNDPIAAISPAIVTALPPIGVILGPYLERSNGKNGHAVVFERPHDSRYVPSARGELEDMTVLALAIKEVEVA